MGNSNSNKWKSLKPFPCGVHLSKPVMIDPNTLIVVPQNIDGHKTDGIYSYNLRKDKWKKEIIYKPRHKIENHCIAFNKFTNTLYIYNNYPLGGKMMRINLTTKKWKINNCNDIGDCSGGCCIIANDRFHLIGGFSSNIHYVWNEFRNKFNMKDVLKDFSSGIIGHRLVYIKQKRIILMFGGYDVACQENVNTVYCYSFKSNKWKRLKVKLLEPISMFGCSSIMNDKYILFFGSNNITYHIHRSRKFVQQYQDIFLFDVEKKKFILIKTKKLKCPQRALYKAVTIERQSLVLISGYLWSVIQKRFLPMDILNLINSFSGVEELESVHLISYEQSPTTHYSIKVANILQCIDDMDYL